jgi:hypothetical protein
MSQKIFRLILLLMLFQLSGVSYCHAQKSKKSVLPRIGTIRDYPATGLMTGCGNSYYYFAYQAKTPGADYVFLSNGDGRIAWMNLNGRDTRLRFIRNRQSEVPPFRSFYRWRDVFITIAVEPFNPPDKMSEDDPASKMKITLRRGRAVKTILAAGEADC